MMSPCKDCKRRKVGCHNVKTCEPWAKYVKAIQERRAQSRARVNTGNDWAQHLQRHGRTISRR